MKVNFIALGALITMATTGLAPGLAPSVSAVTAGGGTAMNAGRAPATGTTAKWAQYQYNAAHTGYNPDETVIGPGNVANLHQLWLAKSSGATGISGVSVGITQAYLANSSDSTLRAWSASTGGLRWSALADSALESTAAVGSGRVFVESDNGTLYAFSTATGAKLWSHSNGGSGTSPVLVKDVVYAAGYFTMNAYDAATGTLLWSTDLPLNGPVRSVPAVWGGRVFVTGGSGGKLHNKNVVVLDASTGAILWAKGPAGFIQGASPVVGANTVYVCTSAGLYALGKLHGDQHWFEPSGCDEDTTPALAQGVLYTAPLGNGNGGIWAFNASTGALLWTTTSSSGDFYDAPAVANGVLYVPTITGAIAAYDTATHVLLWTSPQLGFQGPPAVVNGILYAGGTKGLYAFGP